MYKWLIIEHDDNKVEGAYTNNLSDLDYFLDSIYSSIMHGLLSKLD